MNKPDTENPCRAFPVNWDHQAFRVGIFGGSGTGKTTYALNFIQRSPYRWRFIFDPEEEFARRLGTYCARTSAQIHQQLASGWCLFDPSEMFPDDLEGAVSFWADFSFRFSCGVPGKKLFVIDELQMYCTGHQIPRTLMRLVQTGRRREIDSVFIGPAPNLLHNSIRAQLTEAVCFRLSDPNAFDWAQTVGFDPGELVSLPDHHFVARNLRSGAEVRGPKSTHKSRNVPGPRVAVAVKGSGRTDKRNER